MADKKFYWLKLKKDFFKRHDITIIEGMTNGKDYVLFYLKLLLESVSHEGELRFNETIPYNAEMLATITNTNVDVVRCALKVFGELKLIEILDDETIYMTEVNKMLGSASNDEHTRESNRERQKRYRERQKQLQIEDKRYSNVTCNGEIELDIEKDIDKEKDKKKSTAFVPPSVDMVKEYCLSKGYGVDAEQFIDFYSSKGWMIGKNKMKDWQAAVRTWARKDNKPVINKNMDFNFRRS